jgi:hypothetical protein
VGYIEKSVEPGEIVAELKAVVADTDPTAPSVKRE